MPVYSYIARDSQGKQLKGQLSSDSMQHAITELKMKSLFPIKIDEKKEKAEKAVAASRDIFRQKVKKKHIAIFTRQFSSMLHSGMPLVVIMEVLIKQERNPTFKGILDEINADIMKGHTLSTAMSRHKVFPQILISMVEVGEANGRLDIAFKRVAVNLEREIKLVSKVKSAMIYPIVLLTVTIMATMLLTLLVLPKFTAMFEQMGVKLPPLTRALISISDFMTVYWYFAIGSVVIAVIAVVLLLKEPVMKKKLDRIKLGVPVIGRLQNIILMARFCRTFSSLIEGGVGVIPSLETVRNVISNSYIKASFDEIIQDVQSGLSISQAVGKFTMFTPLVVSTIRIGEESGTLGDVLSNVADIYEEESEAQLQRASALAEPAVTLIMAIGVGLVVISIIQPMFQMYGMIGK
ncbi:MAG: type II secretion system F family protein [Clostridia bacterium]|nr:type II secretion system F family protein [Clostridia bacterium]